ncbi:proto-oncogene DBL isoform X1 [Oncorhynchus tshawytscha]|uniref:proto-oncogene DBL isoform X1 n=1 Tax=Oncorhynchus tshawytscha TaxID=74940 RepID=UPI001C3CC3C3|nr:proto-oncogene DBL isoform X1 [Oncorhynchus tshawytscha]XP_042158999.1 proto-oncogene DBL isoform X1 [Oncorhynchus tshawytscha]
MGPVSLQVETEQEQKPEREMDCYHSLLQAGSQLENTLQQVSVSMSMKEVDGYIEKQVAYLSGGRGEDSSVIVTLPEYSAFSDIPEESLAKVLTYLTLIPRARQPGVKFIIILDRRLDTWTSIKTALARIAASFPGNLHLVLVLRPTSFFQRTVTDLGFRFSQEDFMLKMPVVMLSSVTDLLRYVDENQLTSEFGGTLDYCHSDWIVLRTAIESFAVTVKDIAQMLQAFGTELAETKLPAEGTAIMRLLSTHTDKYRKLKEAIRSVSKEGRHLLASLEASGREEDSLWDVRLDWETVQRLLAQLRGMESAFDGFFEKHHLKLQQYLQLLRYEHRFQEMELSLEHLASQEREMSSSGEKLTQTEQTLRDLDILEAHAQEEMVSAQIIILHGHQLAASHHYAMALILQRGNELRHRCDTLSNALRVKRAHLSRAHRLLLRLGQAQSWCDDGAYLLAQQLVDKFQSKEGAQAALKDMDRFLEGAPSLLSSGPDLLAVEFESVLTPEIQVQIGETFEKHTVVQEMIHNRQVCLRKLADKHVRPIQLVAPRAESPPRSKSPLFSPKHGVDGLKFSFDLSLPGKRTSRKSPASRKIEVMHDYQENRSSLLSSLEGEDSPDLLKRHVMRELIETERVYVEELLSVLLGYRGEMENPALAGLLPPILRSKRNVLFGNMPEIYNFHSRVFLHDLEGCLETPEGVGACFLERKENFKVYECYCQNKPRSESLWRQYSDCAFFQECQKKLEHKLGLDSYLLKPVQRLTKYQLLLKELLKYSAGGCEGTSELQAALAAMLHLLKSVNDSMHQIAITGYQGELCDLGRVLMQGSFSVWISHKKGPTRMKELARFKPTQRHLFLYERALLFCKCREEHGEGADKTPSYSFKHCLKMSAVGITENVKGDVKKFEIWYSGREEVYAVQAPTVEVKTAWLGELRRILTNQQKHLKDERCVDIQMPDHIRRSPPMSESKQQRASFSSEDTVREEQSRPTVPLPKSPAQPTQRARHASHNGHLSGSGGVGWRSGPLSPVRHRGGGHCSAGAMGSPRHQYNHSHLLHTVWPRSSPTAF